MVVFSSIVVTFFLFKKAPPIMKQAWEEASQIKIKGYIGELIMLLFRIIFILINLVLRVEVVYFVAYAVFAILGTFWHQFFFAFHMTYLFLRQRKLKKVFQSVWIPKAQIFYTVVLMMLVLYYWTIFGYINL